MYRLIIKWMLAAILMMHGVGHSLYFLASCTALRNRLTGERWMFSGGVTLQCGRARLLGLVWLAVLLGFVAAGIGLVLGAAWWPVVAIASAILSLVVVIPWLHILPSGSPFGVVLINTFVLIMLLGPTGDDVVDALG